MAMAVPMQALNDGAAVRARATRPRAVAQLLGGGELRQAQSSFDAADLAQMSDAELQRLAHMLRAQALRGVREANGPAHACEAVLRSRGAGTASARHGPALDLRPLAQWDEARPWWRFW